MNDMVEQELIVVAPCTCDACADKYGQMVHFIPRTLLYLAPVKELPSGETVTLTDEAALVGMLVMN